MIPLTEDEKAVYCKEKVCYICRDRLSTNDDNKKYYKVRDHCHYTGKYRETAHNGCNLRYKTSKEIAVVFHNGSTYDYHVIIQELAEHVGEQFEFLRENTEECITFSVPIKKGLDNDKLNIQSKVY